MKVWRKNRTQYAKEFFFNGKMTLDFLVGDYGNGVQVIETLKGEFKKISVSKSNSVGNDKKESEEFEETIDKGVTCDVVVRKYKDGTTTSQPISKFC